MYRHQTDDGLVRKKASLPSSALIAFDPVSSCPLANVQNAGEAVPGPLPHGSLMKTIRREPEETLASHTVVPGVLGQEAESQLCY